MIDKKAQFVPPPGAEAKPVEKLDKPSVPNKSEVSETASKPPSPPSGAAYQKPQQGAGKPARPTDSERQSVSVMQQYLSSIARQVLDNLAPITQSINEYSKGRTGNPVTEKELRDWARIIQDTGYGTANRSDGKFGKSTSRSIDIAKVLANRSGKPDISSGLVEQPAGKPVGSFMDATAEQNEKAADTNTDLLRQLITHLNLSAKDLPEPKKQEGKEEDKSVMLDRFDTTTLGDDNIKSESKGDVGITLSNLSSLNSFYAYVRGMGLVSNMTMPRANAAKVDLLKKIAHDLKNTSDIYTEKDFITLAQLSNSQDVGSGWVDNIRNPYTDTPADASSNAQKTNPKVGPSGTVDPRNPKGTKMYNMDEIWPGKKDSNKTDWLTVGQFDKIFMWFYQRSNYQYTAVADIQNGNVQLMNLKKQYNEAVDKLMQQWRSVRKRMMDKRGLDTPIMPPESGGSKGRGSGRERDYGDEERGRGYSGEGRGGFGMPRGNSEKQRAIQNPPLQDYMNIIDLTDEWGNSSLAAVLQREMQSGTLDIKTIRGGDARPLFNMLASDYVKDKITKGSGGRYNNEGIWLVKLIETINRTLNNINSNWISAVNRVPETVNIQRSQNEMLRKWTYALEEIRNRAVALSKQQGSMGRQRATEPSADAVRRAKERNLGY